MARKVKGRRLAAGLACIALGVLTGAADAVAPPDRCKALGPADADGRLLGHLPYAGVSRDALTEAPADVAANCRTNREALPDLTALMAKARADGVTSLYVVSCHRSTQRQRTLFCNSGPPGLTAAERAQQVAPAGFSEHATGYAVDFADRKAPNCVVEPCFGTTAASRWLLKNAPKFGFELSFPEGNLQGVVYEPWHWRWVGRGETAAARKVFSDARTRFPAPPPRQTTAACDGPACPPQPREAGTAPVLTGP